MTDDVAVDVAPVVVAAVILVDAFAALPASGRRRDRKRKHDEDGDELHVHGDVGSRFWVRPDTLYARQYTGRHERVCVRCVCVCVGVSGVKLWT